MSLTVIHNTLPEGFTFIKGKLSDKIVNKDGCEYQVMAPPWGEPYLDLILTKGHITDYFRLNSQARLIKIANDPHPNVRKGYAWELGVKLVNLAINASDFKENYSKHIETIEHAFDSEGDAEFKEYLFPKIVEALEEYKNHGRINYSLLSTKPVKL